MWIIKLGGSLIGAAELNQWLDLLTQFSDGKIIIVPGGGIFADAVRQAQMLTNLDDQTAHKIAVLAMDQYGQMIAGLNPAIATASSELEIAERGFQHRAIVWLPSKMVNADESIPTNWQVTSDSLAAWLAKKLNAEHLVLVKSLNVAQLSAMLMPSHQQQMMAGNTQQASLHTLSEHKIIDAEFKNYVRNQNFSTWVISKNACSVFKHGFDANQLSKAAFLVNAHDYALKA